MAVLFHVGCAAFTMAIDAFWYLAVGSGSGVAVGSGGGVAVAVVVLVSL